MGLSSLDPVVGSSWSPEKAKTGALLIADLAGTLFLTSFLVCFPCACPELRVVHSPEEAALNKDLKAQWASVLGREEKLNAKTRRVCLLFWAMKSQGLLSREEPRFELGRR